MNPKDLHAAFQADAADVPHDEAADLLPLLRGATRAKRGEDGPSPVMGANVVIGELLALSDSGVTPLVRYAGQPGSRAIAARSSVDLHGQHIGQSVLLVFEHGDPLRPIVIGVVRGAAGWPDDDKPSQVEVDADGQRMIVSAKEQLVLRCGKASITLTKAGKVLIEGSYVLSRSSGVNRVKGGSVQLN
ncbi:MAG: DUF6484 domain-containing protein [Rubrivivax sp.]